MPIHTGQDKNGQFYQWGKTGKKYYFKPKDKQSKQHALNKAKKQQTAIYSSGWKGDSFMKLIKVTKKDSKKVDEDAEILNELNMMSKNLVLPAYKFPNYLELKFDTNKVETIDKNLTKIEKTLDLFKERIEYARKYFNSVKSEAKKKQAELGNGRFLE